MLAQIKQTRTLSILLVEDDPHFRSGLRTLLGGGYTIVGETNCVKTAISLTARRHPDLMLLDMKLEGGDGIALLQQLQERHEKVKPLVLSAHQEGSEISRALLAGAKGYVFKSQVAQQLEDAITTVSQGNVFLPPNVATLFVQSLQAVPRISTTPAEIPHLSNRELEVLQWVAWGASNEGIAKELFITTHTVKLNLEHVYNKLKVRTREWNEKENKFKTDKLVNSRVLAIRKAVKLGLVQL